jgi:hypothetical protein
MLFHATNRQRLERGEGGSRPTYGRSQGPLVELLWGTDSS